MFFANSFRKEPGPLACIAFSHVCRKTDRGSCGQRTTFSTLLCSRSHAWVITTTSAKSSDSLPKRCFMVRERIKLRTPGKQGTIEDQIALCQPIVRGARTRTSPHSSSSIQRVLMITLGSRRGSSENGTARSCVNKGSRGCSTANTPRRVREYLPRRRPARVTRKRGRLLEQRERQPAAARWRPVCVRAVPRRTSQESGPVLRRRFAGAARFRVPDSARAEP